MYGHLRPCSFMTGHAPGSPLLSVVHKSPATARRGVRLHYDSEGLVLVTTSD